MSTEDLVVRIDLMPSSSASRATVVTLAERDSDGLPREAAQLLPQQLRLHVAADGLRDLRRHVLLHQLQLRDGRTRTFFFSESITGLSSSSVMGVSPVSRLKKPPSLPRPQLELEVVDSSGRSISDSFCG